MPFDLPNTIDVDEAKLHFSELLEQTEQGEEITITKHGSPVAKLVPIRRKPTVEERRAAIDRFRKLNITLGSDLKIRDLIEEGRR